MATKDKILDTAERLIANQGFAATSLRQIIGEAGVNLAAVHYHFGSKEELLDQLILRKITSVNEQRIARLDALESEADGRPVPVDRVLAAFFEPMIETGSRNPQFVKVMARLQGEGLIPSIMQKHFRSTISRFVRALRLALPDVSQEEFFWRLQFMFGAMSRAVSDPVDFVPGMLKDERHEFSSVIRRLMVFLAAGFQAPASMEMPQEQEVQA